MIVDEVQTGWGRTGAWFGFQHLGISPDIVVFGKAIGGGLPLAGIAAPDPLMARWTTGEHGTTFGGNPVACAAGLAALTIIARDGLPERAAAQGERLLERMRGWTGRRGVFDVRGRGLMLGIELLGGGGAPDFDRCQAVKKAAQEEGLLILTCGARLGDPNVDNSAILALDRIPDGLYTTEVTHRKSVYTESKTGAADTRDARYRQIESSLRGEIVKGRWPAGTVMPSRRELAKEYGVSLITLERAIAGLLKDGVLHAQDRRGTYVAEPRQAAGAQTPPETGTIARETDAASQGRLGTAAPSSGRLSRTHTVGIVAALYVMERSHLALNDFWVRLLVHSLEHDLARDGQVTRFFNRFQGQRRPLIPLGEAVDAVISDGADGAAVIALGMDPDEIDRNLSVLDRHDLPVVCVTSGEMRRPVSCVTYDNRGAGYQAAQHLLRGGKGEILYLAPFMAPWVKERLEGIEAAAEHAGLPPGAVRTYPLRSGPWIAEEDPQELGYRSARQAFAEGAMPPRIVSANDGVAFGFLRAASERGLRAGEDFHIVGFDDHPEARSVGLTTLRPPMEAMGQAAAGLLRAALRHDQADTLVRLRWTLLPRESTRRPQSAAGHEIPALHSEPIPPPSTSGRDGKT